MLIKISLHVTALAIVTMFSGCATVANADRSLKSGFGKLDYTPATLTLPDASAKAASASVIRAMQSDGYTIEGQTDNKIEFVRKKRGLAGLAAFSADMQQFDFVNCAILQDSDGSEVTCRTYNISKYKDGRVSKNEQTQSPGYRKKLQATLNKAS